MQRFKLIHVRKGASCDRNAIKFTIKIMIVLKRISYAPHTIKYKHLVDLSWKAHKNIWKIENMPRDNDKSNMLRENIPPCVRTCPLIFPISYTREPYRQTPSAESKWIYEIANKSYVSSTRKDAQLPERRQL